MQPEKKIENLAEIILWDKYRSTDNRIPSNSNGLDIGHNPKDKCPMLQPSRDILILLPFDL